MIKTDSILLEHSQAKVEIYKRYLGKYLNILSRTPYVTKIYLFDLMCGEGVYKDGQKGSCIATIDTILSHYKNNNNTCPNIEIWFNDKGQSTIDEGKTKVERVEHLIKQSEISIPYNVHIEYYNKDYNEIIKTVIDKTNLLKRDERCLTFIDPYGYKDIRPEELKSLSINEKTEIFLFLPINLMWRFATHSLSASDFYGGEALKKLIYELFPNHKTLRFETQTVFIEELKLKLKQYTSFRYCTSFIIERQKGIFYSLFIFTNNKKGYEKIVETKWDFDKENGKGFRHISLANQQQGSFFGGTVEISNYSQMVYDYILSRKNVSNQELFDFGLENEHLPSHTNVVLNALKKESRISVEALDGLPVKGNYIEDKHERKVNFKLK
ncbi:MAG TPA: three-Cys-motif partner protein TcmP [Bacteroidia bacterium]|nr:three-Cys-motif partner protein TcmP [Bacteroidia bacterium]